MYFDDVCTSMTYVLDEAVDLSLKDCLCPLRNIPPETKIMACTLDAELDAKVCISDIPRDRCTGLNQSATGTSGPECICATNVCSSNAHVYCAQIAGLSVICPRTLGCINYVAGMLMPLLILVGHKCHLRYPVVCTKDGHK